MTNWIQILTMVFAGAGALSFVALIFDRARRSAGFITKEEFDRSLRDEAERIKQAVAEGGRDQRRELGENILKSFREFGVLFGDQFRDFRNGIDVLRNIIENKLDDAATKHSNTAKEIREEMSLRFNHFNGNVSEKLTEVNSHQKERLDNVTKHVSDLTEQQQRAQDALKRSVEERLDAIRIENAGKLDEMRKTVDEKLQSTLETRLGESFNRVVEQLERVHNGIGEMQSLAAGVGDLKKVLSNVRVRGSFGEMQLEVLLEQFLSPEQVIKNAQIKDNSQERVEFAIKLPGRDQDSEVLLPVDAKFPREDYERLLDATDAGDADAVIECSRALEKRVRECARTIKEKYIYPPRTTDFAILFLPTESLYAEVLRRPGLFEQLQQEYHITPAGPTTLTALLNALQMGFRSLAIERRSSEVWNVLGAVKTEFEKYNKVVDTIGRQIATAAKSVENLGTRTRAMDRKLRDVEKLPETATEVLVGRAMEDVEEIEDMGDADAGE